MMTQDNKTQDTRGEDFMSKIQERKMELMLYRIRRFGEMFEAGTFRSELGCLFDNVQSGLTSLEAADERLGRFVNVLGKRIEMRMIRQREAAESSSLVS
jgi:hypothetical protein